LSGKSNRFFPPLSRAIMDLRICKVWRWSIAALRRKSRVFKRQNGMPWRAVDHNSLACSDKGAALHAIGQSASAIKYLMKALDIDPNNERAYYHLAVCYQALGNLDRSVLACKKMLNVNPFTRAREDIYRLLFLIYQNSNSPHDEIAAIMNGIPSDAIFTNPGPPFSLNATVVGAILRRNLESMITLIQSQKALPILQLYPGYDWFESQKMELSRKFNIPCICHRNFSDLRGKKNYWGHTHPNKNGYRLMAENAYAVITGRFLPACPHSR